MSTDESQFDDKSSNSRPTNVRWIVFALSCGTSWMLYLHRYTFALIKPKLSEEWNLSNEALGWMDFVFSFCYMAFQIPSGLLVDVTGAHLFLGGIIILWSIGLGMHAWAPNVKTLAVARGMFGVGQAGAFASLSRITRQWYPSSIRTAVQGWASVFSGRTGAACANLLFGALLVGIFFPDDWRTALYILVFAGIGLGISFLWLFRDSPRKHPWTNRAEVDLIEEVETSSGNADERPKPPERMPLREMFRRMSQRSVLNLFALNLQSILSSIADSIYSMWIPLFLSQVHKLEFAEIGLLSSVPLLGGACGGAMGGFLNDRMIRRTRNRRWSRTWVALTGKGIAGVLLLTGLLFYDQLYVFCVFLFFVKFFGDWSLSTSWGTITDIGGEATATVFAFNNCIAGLFVVIVAPIFGRISDGGWLPIFVIVGIVYLLCAASWMLVNCTIPLFGNTDNDDAG